LSKVFQYVQGSAGVAHAPSYEKIGLLDCWLLHAS